MPKQVENAGKLVIIHLQDSVQILTLSKPFSSNRLPRVSPIPANSIIVKKIFNI